MKEEQVERIIYLLEEINEKLDKSLYSIVHLEPITENDFTYYPKETLKGD